MLLRLMKISGSMAKADRKAYNSAVLCLQSKPALTPKSASDGARSRVYVLPRIPVEAC